MTIIKKHLKVLVVTSIVTLLPILAGVILWNQLPELMPSHWNMAGEIDGRTSKAFSVFGMPTLMLFFHWVCVIATGADPKKAQHSEKVLHLVFWIIPVLNIVLSVVAYLAALGKDVDVEIIIPVFIGLLFAIVGNYLPKCKQNYTIGIKLPWTLNSEENWNKTHRFAGWLWMICGFAIMLTSLFGGIQALLVIVLLMVAAPFIYSYVLYCKGV